MIGVCCLLYLCQAALAGNLYNPVSYAAYPASTLVAPQPISPLHYASPLRTSVGYGPLAAARVGGIAAPLLHPASIAAPVVSTAYAAPVLQKYAAVPSVAHVPVTRYEAQPGYIQKYFDVAHAKVATSKIQVRRPAIQKQFYDIEERIIVRPIASAVVELDPPISKTQAGPTVVSPALPTAPGWQPTLPVAAYPPQIPQYGPPQQLPLPSAPESPQQAPPSAPENPQSSAPSAPENPQIPFPSAPQNPDFSGPSASDGSESNDSDSITVENEDFRARSRIQEPEPQSRQLQSQPQQERNQQQPSEQNQQPDQPQARLRTIPSGPQQISQTQAIFLSRSLASSYANNNLAPQSSSFTEDVIPSSRALLTEEQNQNNQQRFIELLTGRGGVAEVRSGVTIDAAGEAGQIRGRVLSVTPAPPSSGPADERVSTRRIVVSRPIQTLQEVDVVQPFTKVQRLSVQQPAILKTARIGLAPVNTLASVPVNTYGAYSYLH